MWIYVQRTGELRHGDLHVATGYSGHDKAKNDPAQQKTENMGPIPQGAYLIGSLSESTSHGPLAIHLVPQTGTNTFGRGGFLMHGDSKEAPGSASHGCVIMPRDVREKVFNSQDRVLLVLSGNEATFTDAASAVSIKIPEGQFTVSSSATPLPITYGSAAVIGKLLIEKEKE